MTSGPDLGKRDIVHKGKSEYSGEYSIEDVEINATSTVRRLIFINAPNVIQSEVGLKGRVLNKTVGIPYPCRAI